MGCGFSRGGSGTAQWQPSFPRLSSEHAEIKAQYDVVVIGSGYGGSIAASRCARAGQVVCVLERGKEWLPGEFPETFLEASKEAQISFGGKKISIGESTGLYEFFVGRDLSVVHGCGLGGGSLINANVGIDCDPAVFEDPRWPKEFRDDIGNVMNIDKKHVVGMLKPHSYPDDYPHLKKSDRMRQGLGDVDIENLDHMLYKLPLYVTFEDMKANHVGVPQPKCTGCGNCCGGCNVGAKNTLNMNYLPDAKAHGADLFTKIEVLYISKAHNSDDWLVHYKPTVQDAFESKEQVVRASHVILGAGALGSTKILLRSKERGLDISDRLGKNFTTNGDVLGFSYNGQDDANSIGVTTGKGKKVPAQPPGPCITSVMDFRKLEGTNFEDSFIIQDGTPPSLLNVPYSVILGIASKLIGTENFPVGEALHKAFQELKGQEMEKTMAFLCMSHDDASGQITFDSNHDDIDIEWERVGYGENFERVNKQLEKIAGNLRGTFVKNPVWTDVFGKDVITAHPLGGCRMGDSGEQGVVNHAGQVFDGQTTEVHEGLYVMDGAIITRALGVNPTMTISCLAERCMRLLAARESWKIDYESFRNLDKSLFAQPKPGIRFTEKMVGYYTPSEMGATKTECEFTLTVESNDVENMINLDPNHFAKLSGTVTCPALSREALTVSKGEFQLFKESRDRVDTKEMVYKMVLTDNDSNDYFFSGVKYIHKDQFGEFGVRDTTKLFVDIYRGKAMKGKAELYIKLPNFAKQLSTLEITNTQSTLEKIKWTARFGSFFAKSLWDTYGPVSKKPSTLDTDAPPRLKRPLRVPNDVIPVLHKCITEDNFELRLTRYEGGSKGPVILIHGLGVSSGIYSLDTTPTNLLEYLVQHRYDVWLADWRVSCDLPWAVYQDYTLDDVAKYDHPALIEKVLEVTGQKTVQVVSHCVGSLTLFCSLLSGALAGKVRNVVTSQVSFKPIPHGVTKLKAGLFHPSITDAIGVSGMTADTDNAASWSESLFNKCIEAFEGVTLAYDELCSNPVCHRLTFMYGLLYEHSQIHRLTHDTLHEFSGYASAKVFGQLSDCMRHKVLVNCEGEDVYLPDAYSDERLMSTAYREHIKHLDLPIAFVIGECNALFTPDGLLQCYKDLKEAHASQEYEFVQIPGYGHLDCIFGKNAVYDVYPHILRALDRHAQDDFHTDINAQRRVAKAMTKVKDLTASYKTKVDGAIPHSTQGSLLKPSREVKHPDFDLEELESRDYPDGADDVTDPTEVKKVLKDIEEDMAKERFWVWKPKVKTTNVFKKPPMYVPPEGTDEEAVVVRNMPNFGNSNKRMIIALSDLHLDSTWNVKNTQRLNQFTTKLASIAEAKLNTLILLGDFVEMWLEPNSVGTSTAAERIVQWKKSPPVIHFFSLVRKMSEEDDVRVFYIRGNHDHEMDADTVLELIGDKAEFVPGTLIYLIDSDDGHQYRIRFAHGHDWDIYNSYAVGNICGRPLGYYVTRCVATSDEYMNETGKVLEEVGREILDTFEVLGSFLCETLSGRRMQREVNKIVFERALRRELSDDEGILIADGNWIRMGNVLKYDLFRRAIEKFGSTRTYQMLQASLGDFDDILKECAEDVVVLGHTHEWQGKVLDSKMGKLIYVNTGSWIDHVEECSYVEIVPPSKSGAGTVKIIINVDDATKPS